MINLKQHYNKKNNKRIQNLSQKHDVSHHQLWAYSCENSLKITIKISLNDETTLFNKNNQKSEIKNNKQISRLGKSKTQYFRVIERSY